MSAILLIKEMPSKCSDCPCNLWKVCVPMDEDIDEYINPNEGRLGSCPLKKLPDSKQMENRWFSDDYSKGWNDCLYEIMGETE